MSMGLKLWQGQSLGTQTVTMIEVMQVHTELLVCAARDGAGHFGELNTLFNNIPAIIKEQLCSKVTIWFNYNGDEKFWLDIKFDWVGFNVSVSTSGGSAIPASIAGRSYTGELMAQAKFLQRAIEKAKAGSGCNGAQVHYTARTRSVDAQMKARLGLVDVADKETRRKAAIRGHGRGFDSSVSPFVKWALGKRK